MTGPSTSQPPSTTDPKTPPASDAPARPSSRASMVGWIAASVSLFVVMVGVIGLVVTSLLSPDAGALRQEAMEKESVGDLSGAIQTLNRLEEQGGMTSADRLRRVEDEFQLQKFDAALADLKKIPDSDPLAGSARMTEGRIELRRLHAPAAEHAFRRALELDPKQVQAHRELIYLYGTQLRRQALDREFRAYAKLTTLDYDQCYHWCLIRLIEWDPAEQVKTLRMFVEADPSDRWSRIALADNLRRLGKLEEASSTLEPLPENDPDAAAVRVEIALDRHDQSRVEEILADKSLDDPTLDQIRGRLALSRRDADAAIHYFEKANQVEPNDRVTLTGLASALSLKGQTERASQVRDHARRLDLFATELAKGDPRTEARNDPTMPLKMGLACREAGLWPQAEAWLRLAVAKNPLDSDAKQALYNLLHRDNESEPTD